MKYIYLLITLLLTTNTFSQFIATGGGHTVSICADQTVKSWGRNLYGQLGDGTYTERHTPVNVLGLTNIIQVSAGFNHTLFLKSDGTVYSSGYNLDGQLGDNTNLNRSTPVRVIGIPSNIVKIRACGYHSFFIEDDGDIWACGSNSYGQLGDGTTTDKKYPFKLGNINSVIDVTGGREHSIFLKADGTVYSCGLNNKGQLGNSFSNRTVPNIISSLSNITAIAAGNEHSVFLRSDSLAFACGENGSYELGDSTRLDRGIPVQVKNLKRIIKIAAGITHTLFINADSATWGCGNNTSGALSTGNTINQKAPILISPLSNIIFISGGNSFSVFLKSNGELYSSGSNAFGQLGDGTTDDKLSNIKVPNLCSVLTCLLPNTPTPISGSNKFCENETSNFSVSSVNGADTYTWSVPSGAVINSGQGTTNINVTFGNLSGNVVLTAENSCGPVSRTLGVVVNTHTFSTQNTDACDSLVSPSGMYTWKTNGSYNDTIANAVGCDSIITINLNILNSSQASITDMACGIYSINGDDFTSSGTYTQVLSNSVGCDSTLTLNLTIYPTKFNVNATICNGDSIQIGSNYYKTQGIYKDTLLASTGCDSIITLDLKVKPIEFTQNFSICLGENIVVGLNTYDTTGIYLDSLIGMFGCDSIVTTNLTVHPLPGKPIITQNDKVLTCDLTASAYTWYKNGVLIPGAISKTYTITVSGQYEVKITDANNCSNKSDVFTAQIAGLDDLTSIGELKIYPNPTAGKLFIQLDSKESNGSCTIKLYSLIGEQLISEEHFLSFGQNDITLYLNQLTSGIYYLEIKSGESNVTKKINLISK
jgi:alpha-tubulin suppressor-like RCC1 family protein